ncbi:unnamed protein product [Prunus brigantina]
MMMTKSPNGRTRPDNGQRAGGELAAGEPLLHYHPQAQSDGRDYPVLECRRWAYEFLLRQVLDWLLVQIRIFCCSLYQARKHRHPDLCCCLL